MIQEESDDANSTSEEPMSENESVSSYSQRMEPVDDSEPVMRIAQRMADSKKDGVALWADEDVSSESRSTDPE